MNVKTTTTKQYIFLLIRIQRFGLHIILKYDIIKKNLDKILIFKKVFKLKEFKDIFKYCILYLYKRFDQKMKI